MSVGNGPPCPADNRHGRLYNWDRAGALPGRDWFCPHQAHGARGKFFTDQEAHGAYELKETDMASILATAAQAVADERETLDSAVANVARQTKRSTQAVRDALNEAVAEIRAKSAAAQAEREAAKAEKPRAEKPAAARVKLTHIEPAQFAAVRDELKLTNKQVSAALADAGMGCTLSRVTELTHSKGSSERLFDQFTAALGAWRAASPTAE